MVLTQPAHGLDRAQHDRDGCAALRRQRVQLREEGSARGRRAQVLQHVLGELRVLHRQHLCQ